ncbi:hypothetical protein D8674_013119 [Pyrus ussuriensis x Pyrus communis]|uniref:Uncharacterized protein n=1 Tax=Pyrus ussuriensis x Pyrus communis TaxID=2448454 RepID=A0A5N5GVS1_9ROSA|nr:hypothetical protein D8674_013119 [Pyrus ussuriensis x Pyrus communis]
MKHEAWSKWVDELEPIWKQKLMANGIYELIMMSKTTIPIKYELLLISLLFQNTGTNTFNFRVSSLKLSGICVNITHDWSSPSHPVAESSKAHQSVTSLEYNPTTFKSYETSFMGFIPFAKTMLNPYFPTADPWMSGQKKMMLMPWFSKRRLQRQLSKKQALAMFLRILCTYLRCSASKRQKLGLKQRLRLFVGQDLLLWNLLTLSSSKKHDISPHEMPASEEGQQSDKEVLAKILEELKVRGGTPAPQVEQEPAISSSSIPPAMTSQPSLFEAAAVAHPPAKAQGFSQGSDNFPQPVMSRVVLPRPSRVSKISRIPIPRPRKSAAAESSTFIFINVATTVAASDGAGMDFFASFTFKALQDVQRALIDLYQAQWMSKVQYESFISFFKNLRKQANRVRCYKEKHIKTSITMQ